MGEDTELAQKTERLTRMLVAEDLGGVIISAQHNFSWLTGGSSNGIDISRETGSSVLLVRRDGKRFVLANRTEMPRLLAEEICANEFSPVDFAWEQEKADPRLVVDLAKKLLCENQSLGSDVVTCSTRSIEGPVANCRYQLTQPEIERYRLLGRDAAEVIEKLARELEPGQSELEIARRAMDGISACNARALVTLIAADDRMNRYRHPVPTELRWERTLMIVICARRSGLIASLTRIISAGEVPEDLKRRTISAARVSAELRHATRPGTTGAELYELAARCYRDEGWSGEEQQHHQGGACGYRTRDWVAHPGSADLVNEYQAFAWNPSITGTKVEGTCIAFPDRVETITSTPTWPQISTLVNGHEYFSPDIFSL